MGRRHHPAQFLLGIGDALLLRHAGRDLDTVAVQGGKAAELEPAGSHGGIGQEFLECRFMVAAQMHGAEGGGRAADHDVDHLAGMQPAVHVIAEIYQIVDRSGRRFGILGHHVEQAHQQIRAAMDVTDRVDPDASRHGRGDLLFILTLAQKIQHHVG